ncbi:MAG: hypothetical protein AAGJ52_05880 [Pseudomonadota bacterium]
MMVTYRNELEYAGVAEAFEVIRDAHRVVLIDGRGLSNLGQIVGSTTWFETVTEFG